MSSNIDIQLPTAKQSGTSLVVPFVLAVNIVFGSGVLAMPGAIQKAGLALGLGLLLVVSAVAWLTVVMVIEAISRLSFVAELFQQRVLEEEENDTEVTPAIKPGFSPACVRRLRLTEEGCKETAELEHMTNWQWEVNDLCAAFLHPMGSVAYDTCLVLYTWAVMWLYVTVWSSAMLMVVPIPGLTSFHECNAGETIHGDCAKGYRWMVLVCAVVLAVLSVKEWKAMGRIQGFFTLFANVCLVVMLVSIFVALWHVAYKDDKGATFSSKSSAPYVAHLHWADFSHFGALFGTCIFSQMAHQGTATVLDGMKEKRGYARSLFAAVFVTTFLFYTVLSVAASIYFGDGTNPIVTLNWQTYTTSTDSTQTTGEKVLLGIIVLFPVFTTSAGYMLLCRAIGNVFVYWAPPTLRAWCEHIDESLGNDNDQTSRSRCSEASPASSSLLLRENKGETSTTLAMLCRTVAYLPPIIGGFFLRQVSVIVSVAGLFGFFVMIFFPSILQLSSTRVLTKMGLNPTTPYSGWYSSTPVVVVLLVAGAGGFCYYFYNVCV
eukprot:Sspe_Gene.67560::Locus_39858_Transcript_2_3_Confidence_0.500_Length_1796::g.67560::m.67560